MPLAPGTRLGEYEIVALLGAGGMGEVYRARDPRLEREVAIKVLAASATGDAEALRRFEQEARTVAALNHPNLLTIYDVGRGENGLVYLVTELLEGLTLRQKLEAGSLSQRQSADFGGQIARGLAAAHTKGVVHRDLKPENIFCCADGRVKILDFGLAKLAERAAGEDKTLAAAGTAAGVVLGTVGYMAPEQARGLTTDTRSDIFSLGCVLYEMLAGRRAFRGDSAVDVISAILREDPPEIAATGSGAAPISPGLDRIVRHCLEKEPQQRFQSASDVAFSLSEPSSASTHASAVGALPPAPHSSTRSRRLRFGLLGTAGLVIAVAATWELHPGVPPAPVFHRLTFQQQVLDGARFLPGGQGVLGTATPDGASPFQLFTSRLDVPGTQELGTAAAEVLAVGNGQAAILQHEHLVQGALNVGTLATMPLAGGAPRPVLDDIISADFAPGRGDLAVVRFHPATTTTTLEYPIGHALVTTGGWMDSVRFSPDGHRIGFLNHPAFGDNLGSAAVVDLSGHEKILTRRFAFSLGLAWSPRGNEVWYTAGDGLYLMLHAVTLAGHDRVLLSAPFTLRLEDVLPDGRALLTSFQERIDAELVTPAEPRPQDLTVLDWTEASVMSADGQQILVGDEDYGPAYGTFLRRTDGSPPVRLGDGDPVALSPDGQWAASVLAGSQQLELLPIGAGDSRQLTHGSVAFFATPADAWLPDGKAILAQGREPGHSARDYLVTLDGAVRPVTPEGISSNILTPDGDAVLAQPQKGLVPLPFALYPLAGGPPRPVHGLGLTDTPLRFAPGGEGVYVSSPCPGTIGRLCSDIARVNWNTGQRLHLFTLTPPATTGLRGYTLQSISADGRAYTITDEHELGTLYLVTGLH